jgi:DNA-binding NarL/FixJ family response regulator
MQERAEKVGGTLRVRSKPGEGTQIIVRIPKLLEVDPEEEIRGWRVLIVDDHQLILEGMHNLLRTRGVQVVGLAQDGLQAQAMAAQLQPNLILMDVEMPVCDGLEATRQIKAQWPQMKVVMLTAVTDEEKLFTALRYGASGYLLKSVDGSQFFHMLAAALRGETVLSPQLAAKVLTQFAQTPPQSAPASPDAESESVEEEVTLTFRQQEVLELVVQGLTNQEIADRLSLSERTIKHHVSQILARFQLKSRYELSRFTAND